MAKPDNLEMDAVSVTRRAEAVNFRVAGFTYRQIGDRMGISGAAAHKLVKKELTDTRDLMREQVAEVRGVNCRRLEMLINRMWVKALPTNANAHLDYEAIRTIIRAIEKQSRLMGAEAPQKHQVDLNHLNSQVGLVVEMIARVIPDDSVPKVYEAMEEAMVVIERRERSLTTE